MPGQQAGLAQLHGVAQETAPAEAQARQSRAHARQQGRGVRIFLKEFGITKLLKKNEEPKYHKKIVVAHPDDELDVLYGAADAEETFLLDFFIGSMARDHEAYGKYGHPDLTGTTLTLYGKQKKTRTVEISQRLADAIRERRKRSNSKALFVNRNGKPDKHLLRKLQNIAKKAGQSSIPNFTSCAKPAQAGVTPLGDPCRRPCSNWDMSR